MFLRIVFVLVFALNLVACSDDSSSTAIPVAVDSPSLEEPIAQNSEGDSAGEPGTSGGEEASTEETVETESETVTEENPVDPVMHTLFIDVDGVGEVSGSMTASVCASTCQIDIEEGEVFTLSASSGTEIFDYWSGACSGSDSDCELTMTADLSVEAHFFAASDIDCASNSIHCVDENAGAQQEYETIQAAVDVATQGHTVVVFEGDYAGFEVENSGVNGNPITVRTVGTVNLDSVSQSGDAFIRLTNVNYVIVDGFAMDVNGSSRFGIAARGASADDPMRGLIVRNNFVENATTTNLYLSQVADSFIENNEGHNAIEQHGIYLSNGGSDNTVLSGNILSGNQRNGIHFNGDLYIGGDGLHTDLTITGNIIYENVANGLDMDGVQDAIITNNVIYDNGRHAVRGFMIDSADGPANYLIANNTFHGNSGWAVKLTQDDGGHVIFNNIFLGNAGSVVIEDSSYAQSDYNIVDDAFSVDGESTVGSLSDWQSLGKGANSVIGNAASLFTNHVAKDFTIQDGSLADDTGVSSFATLNAPVVDIDGGSRPQGNAHDIGAYEQ